MSQSGLTPQESEMLTLNSFNRQSETVIKNGFTGRAKREK